MKNIISILFLFACLTSIGQPTDYKFIYEFRVSHQQIENQITIDTLNSIISCMTLSITDLEGNELPGVSAFIEYANKNEEIFADKSGKLSVSAIKEGNITVSYIGFERYKTEFHLIPQKEIKFEIRLAQTADPLPTIYEIHSKKRIKKQEREKIIRCVVENESDEKCKSEDYFILEQI
jgi:hypothetical protein